MGRSVFFIGKDNSVGLDLCVDFMSCVFVNDFMPCVFEWFERRAH